MTSGLALFVQSSVRQKLNRASSVHLRRSVRALWSRPDVFRRSEAAGAGGRRSQVAASCRSHHLALPVSHRGTLVRASRRHRVQDRRSLGPSSERPHQPDVLWLDDRITRCYLSVPALQRHPRRSLQRAVSDRQHPDHRCADVTYTRALKWRDLKNIENCSSVVEPSCYHLLEHRNKSCDAHLFNSLPSC